MTSPRLSIIIVNWNTRDLLDRCIDSVILHLEGTITFEIIVIDNASADSSTAMVESRYPHINLIKNADNIGFANAVNQGAMIASGRLLLLLNSDATLLDGQLSYIVDMIEQDPGIGIATGKMVDGSGHVIPAYYRFPGFLYLIKSYTLDRIYTLDHQIRGCARACRTNTPQESKYAMWTG